MGFPDGSVDKESTHNPREEGDVGLIPEAVRSPEEDMATTPVFFPGESHGQRSLKGYSQWGRKESDTTEQLSTHNRKNARLRPKIHGF